MKQHRLIFLVIFALIPFALYAQSAKDEIAEDPFRAGGCYYSYQFDTPDLTPTPKGFKPFHISHYGRHGSRYVTKDAMPMGLMAVMDSAYCAGKLTEFGLGFYKRLKGHYSDIIYKSGDLSSLGWDQHHRIAKKLYGDYKSVFRRRPEIFAYATQSQRCIMSMNSFCQSLKEIDPKLNITEITSRSLLPELNPHASENPWIDTTRHYFFSPDNDPWGGNRKEFQQRNYSVDSICDRFFVDSYFPESVSSKSSFVSNLYHIVLDTQCLPGSVSLMDAFTVEELYGIWRTNNYKAFLENGPVQFRDISLLENLISRFDEDLQKDCFVRLRFGHDMDLIPLLCFMEADDWNFIPDCADKIEDTFRTYRVTMASTLYFVFYRSKRSEDIIFKAVFNGKELEFHSLTPYSGPYYRWSDFRNFCIEKIDRVNNQSY